MHHTNVCGPLGKDDQKTYCWQLYKRGSLQARSLAVTTKPAKFYGNYPVLPTPPQL